MFGQQQQPYDQQTYAQPFPNYAQPQQPYAQQAYAQPDPNYAQHAQQTYAQPDPNAYQPQPPYAQPAYAQPNPQVGTTPHDIELHEMKHSPELSHSKGKTVKMDKKGNSDTAQRVETLIKMFLDAYKVVMGSLLTLFVPMECEYYDAAGNVISINNATSHSCGIQENIDYVNDKNGWVSGYDTVDLYQYKIFRAAFALNFATVVVFVAMYFTEYRRESQLIKYLDIDDTKPNDNEGCMVSLGSRVHPSKMINVHRANKWYEAFGAMAVLIFICNAVVSGIAISFFAQDGIKSWTALISNILLLLTKVVSVRTVLKTDPWVFKSAYMTTFKQFNDADDNYAMDSEPPEDSSGYDDDIAQLTTREGMRLPVYMLPEYKEKFSDWIEIRGKQIEENAQNDPTFTTNEVYIGFKRAGVNQANNLPATDGMNPKKGEPIVPAS